MEGGGEEEEVVYCEGRRDDRYGGGDGDTGRREIKSRVDVEGVNIVDRVRYNNHYKDYTRV